MNCDETFKLVFKVAAINPKKFAVQNTNHLFGLENLADAQSEFKLDVLTLSK